MDLFERAENKVRNYLPYDGEVYYFGPIFSKEESEAYLNILSNQISWQPDRLMIDHYTVLSGRKYAWHGEKAFSYRYSGSTKIAEPWNRVLLELKASIYPYEQQNFNSCLLNYYSNSGHGMGWHCDNEPEMESQAAIASLSFGAHRRFCFKHKKTNELIDLILEPGSLLVMKGCQDHWLHCLPKSKQVSGTRINLTYRAMKPIVK